MARADVPYRALKEPKTKEDGPKKVRSPMFRMVDGKRSRVLWVDVLQSTLRISDDPKQVSALVFTNKDVPYLYYQEALLMVHFTRDKAAAHKVLDDGSIRLLLGKFDGSTFKEQHEQAKAWVAFVAQKALDDRKPVKALVTWGGPGLLVVHSLSYGEHDARKPFKMSRLAVDMLRSTLVGTSTRYVSEIDYAHMDEGQRPPLYHCFFQWMTRRPERVRVLSRWISVDESMLDYKATQLEDTMKRDDGDDDDFDSDSSARDDLTLETLLERFKSLSVGKKKTE